MGPKTAHDIQFEAAPKQCKCTRTGHLFQKAEELKQERKADQVGVTPRRGKEREGRERRERSQPVPPRQAPHGPPGTAARRPGPPSRRSPTHPPLAPLGAAIGAGLALRGAGTAGRAGHGGAVSAPGSVPRSQARGDAARSAVPAERAGGRRSRWVAAEPVGGGGGAGMRRGRTKRGRGGDRAVGFQVRVAGRVSPGGVGLRGAGGEPRFPGAARPSLPLPRRGPAPGPAGGGGGADGPGLAPLRSLLSFPEP